MFDFMQLGVGVLSVTTSGSEQDLGGQPDMPGSPPPKLVTGIDTVQNFGQLATDGVSTTPVVESEFGFPPDIQGPPPRK